MHSAQCTLFRCKEALDARANAAETRYVYIDSGILDSRTEKTGSRICAKVRMAIGVAEMSGA